MLSRARTIQLVPLSLFQPPGGLIVFLLALALARALTPLPLRRRLPFALWEEVGRTCQHPINNIYMSATSYAQLVKTPCIHQKEGERGGRLQCVHSFDDDTHTHTQTYVYARECACVTCVRVRARACVSHSPSLGLTVSLPLEIILTPDSDTNSSTGRWQQQHLGFGPAPTGDPGGRLELEGSVEVRQRHRAHFLRVHRIWRFGCRVQGGVSGVGVWVQGVACSV
jgi:hypothetical protein